MLFSSNSRSKTGRLTLLSISELISSRLHDCHYSSLITDPDNGNHGNSSTLYIRQSEGALTWTSRWHLHPHNCHTQILIQHKPWWQTNKQTNTFSPINLWNDSWVKITREWFQEPHTKSISPLSSGKTNGCFISPQCWNGIDCFCLVPLSELQSTNPALDWGQPRPPN